MCVMIIFHILMNYLIQNLGITLYNMIGHSKAMQLYDKLISSICTYFWAL